MVFVIEVFLCSFNEEGVERYDLFEDEIEDEHHEDVL